MSVASEIERLESGKAGIVASIRAKGVEVADSDKLGDLASKIEAIEGVSPTITSVLYDATGVSDGAWTKTGKVKTATVNTKAGSSVGRTVVYGNSSVGTPRLPSGYTELEYIESDGSVRVDTGVIPTNNTSFELDLEPLQEQQGASVHYLSMSATKYFALRLRADFSGFAYRWGSSALTNVAHEGSVFSRHVFKLTKNVAQVDNAAKTTFSNVSFTQPKTLPLFCIASNSGTFAEYSKARCYSLKIWEGDTATRDFVPCKRDSDGEIGLFDLINSAFYAGEGSGSLKSGPEVYIPNEILSDVSFLINGNRWSLDLGGHGIKEGQYAVINADGSAYFGDTRLPDQTMPKFAGGTTTITADSNMEHYFDMQYQS